MAISVQVQAPAKLNLALAVGPPDERGIHPIRSWMITVSLADDLEVTRLQDTRKSHYAVLWHAEARRRREIDWPVSRDLAVRGHLGLHHHGGRTLAGRMKARERSPAAGGPGGGDQGARPTRYGFPVRVLDVEPAVDPKAHGRRGIWPLGRKRFEQVHWACVKRCFRSQAQGGLT